MSEKFVKNSGGPARYFKGVSEEVFLKKKIWKKVEGSPKEIGRRVSEGYLQGLVEILGKFSEQFIKKVPKKL